MADTTEPGELFWDLATDLLGRDGVEEGTLMGGRCLRVNDDFLRHAQPQGQRPGGKTHRPAGGPTGGERCGPALCPGRQGLSRMGARAESDPSLWASLPDDARRTQS